MNWYLNIDTYDCLLDPCQNNGRCKDLVNDYQCDCMAGFSGSNCENSECRERILCLHFEISKSLGFEKEPLRLIC